LKANKLDVRFIPNDYVVLVKTKQRKSAPEVGQGWQPQVAQFLLDIFPAALESGMELSDLYRLATLTNPVEISDALDAMDLLYDDDDDDSDDDEEL
jgi:hypothetical protein